MQYGNAECMAFWTTGHIMPRHFLIDNLFGVWLVNSFAIPLDLQFAHFGLVQFLIFNVLKVAWGHNVAMQKQIDCRMLYVLRC